MQTQDHISLLNVALTQHQMGHLQEAELSYRDVLKLHPSAEIYNNLGIVLHQQGKFDAAIAIYSKALTLNPDLAEAHFNLGMSYYQQHQINEAIHAYESAVQLRPNYPQAHRQLGKALQKAERLAEAVKACQHALEYAPNDDSTYFLLGLIFAQQNQPEQAQAAYLQALKHNPENAQAYYNLGVLLSRYGQRDAAIKLYIQALRCFPDYLEAHINLGNLLQEKHQFELAIQAYQQAIKCRPDYAEGYVNIGNAYKCQNKLTEAIAAYQTALSINPRLAQARWGICMSQLPIIYTSADEIYSCRERYKTCLSELADYYQAASLAERVEAADAVGALQPFYLTYQGLNDRNLQQIYGELIHLLMASCYPQWSQPRPLPSLGQDQKIKVGIVSGFFNHHSVWKIPIKGWIENLNRERFEIVAYYTGTRRDSETVAAIACCDKFVQGPATLPQWCERILQDAPHVLIYPEFGMDPMSVRLGALNLAAVQMAFGGHPETSGLPTIQYHLSSDLMEPDHAQEHYSEQLIRLPNLAVCYDRVETNPKDVSKYDLGLEDGDVMYWCCQSLFKYLPQHDDVFAAIAQAVPQAKFVFIAHESEAVTAIFRDRMKRAFDQVGLDYQQYCRLLPRMDGSAFTGTVAIADVFLDSIGWSGNNTIMESLPFHIPIVTWPGEMMRSRHAMAILRRLGIEETIVSSKTDYIQLAIRLGDDVNYRRYLANQIAENCSKAYNDLSVIYALEDCLECLVAKPA
ncbi:hypothetical protein C7271_06470 [filamentous cyanobacterium CCP5]|nr:hypothetical protein C7271_06470 [filamentous cyanobacterium CCP5]